MIRVIIQTLACFAGTTKIAFKANRTLALSRLRLSSDGPESIARRFIDTEYDMEPFFAQPKSGRVAVKVIDYLGDEVMRVFRAQPGG